MLRNVRRGFVGAVGAGLAFVAACTGDDPTPAPASSSYVDGGGTDGPSAVTDTGSPVEDASVEDTGSLQDASDAAAYDAGPPNWNATIPAGTQSVLASLTDPTFTCKIEFVSDQTAVAPPAWQVFLRKVDAPAAVCNEPKGVRALGTGYTTPAAAMLRQQASNRFVVAFSMKQSLSGSSPEVLQMKQVDWSTGNDMHDAVMKTKAVQGIPANPSLSVTSVFFCDPTEDAAGTVHLKGTGTFPGESGTGTYFYAVYNNFISGAGQLPAAADTCVRAD